MGTSTSGNWRVEIIENGRSGNLIYHEDSWDASFYYEFGGGDVIAIIYGRPASEWLQKYPWAVFRRQEILERVAGETIRLKAKSCVASFDEKSGNLLLRNQKQ
jgi:hypothetical protein